MPLSVTIVTMKYMNKQTIHIKTKQGINQFCTNVNMYLKLSRNPFLFCLVGYYENFPYEGKALGAPQYFLDCVENLRILFLPLVKRLTGLLARLLNVYHIC
jgi:hypothetical protein